MASKPNKAAIKSKAKWHLHRMKVVASVKNVDISVLPYDGEFGYWAVEITIRRSEGRVGTMFFDRKGNLKKWLDETVRAPSYRIGRTEYRVPWYSWI